MIASIDRYIIKEAKKHRRDLYALGSCSVQCWIYGTVDKCNTCPRAMESYGLFCINRPTMYMGVLC